MLSHFISHFFVIKMMQIIKNVTVWNIFPILCDFLGCRSSLPLPWKKSTWKNVPWKKAPYHLFQLEYLMLYIQLVKHTTVFTVAGKPI